MIPFHERDVDITVLGMITPEPDWIPQSFGYHVNVPGSRLYIDIWVFKRERAGDTWTCKGPEDRCFEWEREENTVRLTSTSFGV